MKIHILGAPGAGITTLGKALAEHLSVPYFDTDDYHWFTDDALPYRRRRNPEHRRQLLGKDLATHKSWVLSGALCGWGDVFIPQFDKVIYRWLPAEIRLSRIEARERLRFGAERVAPGGDLHVVFEKFLQWAAAYDEDSSNIRSQKKELEWLIGLQCPVLRIEKVSELKELLGIVVEWIQTTES